MVKNLLSELKSKLLSQIDDKKEELLHNQQVNKNLKEDLKELQDNLKEVDSYLNKK